MQSAALRGRRLPVKGKPDLAAQQCRTRESDGGLVALKGGSAQLGPRDGEATPAIESLKSIPDQNTIGRRRGGCSRKGGSAGAADFG
eukprot:7949240-Heterocapsa_arctica.AAC.1